MKRIIICMYSFFVFLLVFYFGWESNSLGITTSWEFLSNNLHSFNRYLFVGSLIFCPLILMLHINYLEPMVYVRIKVKLFEYIWALNLIKTLFIELFVLISFVIISYYFNLDDPFSIINFSVILQLFSFVFMCFVIQELVYYNTYNIYLGFSTVIVSNILLLLLVNILNYYIIKSPVSNMFLLKILFIYSVMINFLGSIYIYNNLKKKELI